VDVVEGEDVEQPVFGGILPCFDQGFALSCED
jgi:hypothetical protein